MFSVRSSARADAGSGVLAQLVERLNGIEEVRGSNPLGSTVLFTSLARGERGPTFRLHFFDLPFGAVAALEFFDAGDDLAPQFRKPGLVQFLPGAKLGNGIGHGFALGT